ncbi:GHKL domain-containing protein, partial [uncultured Oscillibacter sp.]|uniref:sensor histidine kinase n=1 Tax=uncultured Oscillibacter sp. TaxID=876091 RepID=UPI002635A7B9
QVISRILVEFKDGVLLQLYERHPAFLAVIPVLALLFYAGAYLTIAFQQGMAALREEQATHYMEYQQTQAIRARIHEAEQFYTRIRGLKHEMRGHLTNIKGLAQSGEYESLTDYIAKMDESMSGFELTLQTGNPVTDVIVNDIRRRCLDLGIRFQVEFHYPEPGAYDAFDVGIILQNLLQNAVEACEKVGEGERFIVLTGKRKGRFFLIEVKNSFAGEVVFGQDGLPVTTKQEDAPMHGIGLANVRREAEKYMGELELKAVQQEFSAAVLLQERSSL